MKIISFAKALTFFTAGSLLSESAFAGGTVTSCTEASLRAAMAGGGTVTFACDGTITLAGTISNAFDSVLDGRGHQLTISGNGTRRVFFVNTNVTLTLSNLTIASGSSDQGAGIYNAGGHLVLQNCILADNHATGQAGAYNSGNLGTNGYGGALFNAGVAIIANTTFSTNLAAGGAGGSGTNRSYGTSGPGGAGGVGCGGAIYNSGELVLSCCTMAGNTATGGIGGVGGAGGSGGIVGGHGGDGGVGGDGQGGALFNNGVAKVVNTTIAENSCSGGAGGAGGNGGGYNTSMYGGDGGNGNTGGNGSGAGIYDLTGLGRLTNCTVALNSSVAGGGGAAGHGVYATYGSGSPGLPGPAGSANGGGICPTAGSYLINALLAFNTPANGLLGIVDGGHNLSSDYSCSFTNRGSLNGVNLLLGPLMKDGGQTPTLPLLAGSPAIDAGDGRAAPPTDQRGVPRPIGLAADVGAYECGPPGIILPPLSRGLVYGSTVDFSATATGYPALSYQWFFNATNIMDQATNPWLELTNLHVSQSGLYTVVVTNVFGSATSAPARLDVFSEIVMTCSEAALRAALGLTRSVMFDCDGTIALSNTIPISTNTVLDGHGHQITISGNSAVRVFYVAPEATFTVANLTIANGSNDSGAGIYNSSGGGLIVSNCLFVANLAQGMAAGYDTGTNGQHGCGGAICNSGTAIALNCTFVANSAVGGAGGSGLMGNFSPGGPGGAGGDGDGGAICNFGTLTLSGCLLASNSVCGGLGGSGGWGGFAPFGPGLSGGQGGSGGSGNGGALFNHGPAALVNNTVALNSGAGAQGGYGGGGGFGSSPDYPRGSSGGGGPGGSAYSAIYDVSGQSSLTNCTVALNRSTQGTGGTGSFGGGNGTAGGGLKTTGDLLLNTLLSANTPSNCSGTITDAGHNLSSDDSCAFTGAGSMNNTDPKLGPLANHGGPTLTMALRPGSPAIDAGSSAGAPTTDQRGIPRPQGPGVDIGAFEYQYIPVFTGANFQGATNFWLRLSGLLPVQAYQLQTSTNLVEWFDLANLVAGPNGVCEFVDGSLDKCAPRFYRIKASSQ